MIRRIRILLFVLISIVAIALIFEVTRPYRPDNPIDSFVDGVIGRRVGSAGLADDGHPEYIILPADSELEGFLPVSDGRQGYQDDEMTLVIPILDKRLPVKAGTLYSQLSEGPGLFESSGMPGEPDANVSIAGHRTRDAFYYLDRLGIGSRIELIYNSSVFTYVFYDSNIVLPSEWSVIADQGFECCTLITCTPIGVANRRLVVRFVLESVSEY